MATVYLATDSLHQRDVAIKVIRPDLVPILGPDRFLREIRIASQLHHPHILPLLDSGDIGGRLYYAMPVARGETLRARLDREKQLPLDDAVAITRDVADALRYAHERGIVHRDIKPENILLEGGRAVVADFGIARLTDATVAGDLSSSGIAIGTPAYMSPEQASADRSVDGRSDIYSLGCVLYEMLAGERLFSGPSAQVIAKRHMYEKVPSLALARPDLPPWVQGVVEKALAKTAADRYATGAELIRALEDRRGPVTSEAPRPWRRWLAMAAALTALALAAVRWLAGPVKGASPAPMDSLRYLVVPFEHRGGVPADLNEDELLREALRGWTGITVVEGFQIREILARRPAGPLTAANLRDFAHDAGAGRSIRGEVLLVNDSMKIHAVLYNAGRGVVMREGTVKLARDLTNAEAGFTSLANQLLVGSTGPNGGSAHGLGTRSLPALEAFGRGKAAIDQWDLSMADSGFAAALRYDSTYAQAALWLAQVRAWNNAPPATWRLAAERAAEGKDQFTGSDRTLSDALLALNRGDLVRACGLWQELTKQVPFDFASWYGLGTCLVQDKVVVRDAASPSRWRFRSSYYTALRSLQRAFEILPSTHKGYRGEAFEGLRRLLQVADWDQLRLGRAALPDTLTFASRPSWSRDSLVWVPFPMRDVMEGRAPTVGPAIDRGVVTLRQLFFAIATSWASAYPQSPDAVEAVGIALDMIGSGSAIDSIRKARALAIEPLQKARLGTAEVWLRLKAALPSDAAAIASARSLADSLLEMRTDGLDRLAVPLLSLASLTGRASLAMQLSRSPTVAAAWRLEPPLSESAPQLLILAAFSGPPDSLRQLGLRVSNAIAQGTVPSDRLAEQVEWLGRPATLAFPTLAIAGTEHLVGRGDNLLDAQNSLLHGDTNAVRRAFENLAESRRNVEPEWLPFDGLVVETRLLMAAGDTVGAIKWLSPSLAALHRANFSRFGLTIQPIALVRSMVLRADLAAQTGDMATAASWARPVTVLWSSADQFLRPTVDRMARLAKHGPRE